LEKKREVYCNKAERAAKAGCPAVDRVEVSHADLHDARLVDTLHANIREDAIADLALAWSIST
jgi:hypothetical protein